MSAKKTIVSLLAGLTVLLAAGSAFADGEGTVAMADEQTRLMSLSWNVIQMAHPYGPMYQFTGEFKGANEWGAGLLGGYGTMTTDNNDAFSKWEVGAQGNYYLLGNFDHGMQLGAQVVYESVEGEAAEGTVSAVGTGSAWRMGPYIGYKIITDVGFTFNGQLGAQYLTGGEVEATATDSQTGDTASASGEIEDQWGGLLRLNIGWSF